MPLGVSDAAWLAGILEGEGSFMMSVSRGCRYPCVTVNMTDRDIIERVTVLLGCSVYVIPNRRIDRKQSYRATVQGSRAAEIMTQLRPWMGLRRGAKIDEILKEYGEIEPTEVRRRRVLSRCLSQARSARVRPPAGSQGVCLVFPKATQE